MKEEAKGELIFTLDKVYKLKFERYYLSDQIERIKVFGKTSELLLQSDRPEIKANNKRRAIKWKIISELNQGIFKNTDFLNTLFNNLEYALDRIDFPRQPWIHPKNY